MKSDRTIIGAVSVAGHPKAFVAGDEDALQRVIDKDKDKKLVDVDHLTKSGALEGFGADSEEVPSMNKQRDPSGKRADSDAAKADKEAASGETAEGTRKGRRR